MIPLPWHGKNLIHCLQERSRQDGTKRRWDSVCANAVAKGNRSVSIEDGIKLLVSQWSQQNSVSNFNTDGNGKNYERILAWILLMTKEFNFSATHLHHACSGSGMNIDEEQFIRTPWEYPFLLLPSFDTGPSLFYSVQRNKKMTVYAVICNSANCSVPRTKYSTSTVLLKHCNGGAMKT
eukprot:gb/GECG01008430.1/.p1 GENE.gb/GECG01008430.1/~~gb/GECG01008430.1/.p1  ORF type:complete len:179 (+),score=10.09 gb/GECG01008430.1/:1-537(+)